MIAIIDEHFDFLKKDYSAKKVGENEYSLHYQTAFCRISFLEEKTFLYVTLGPIDDSWSFDLSELVAYKIHDGNFEAIYNLNNQPLEIVWNNQAKWLARALKEHASDLLKGDFSIKKQLESFRKQRSQEFWSK